MHVPAALSLFAPSGQVVCDQIAPVADCDHLTTFVPVIPASR